MSDENDSITSSEEHQPTNNSRRAFTFMPPQPFSHQLNEITQQMEAILGGIQAVEILPEQELTNTSDHQRRQRLPPPGPPFGADPIRAMSHTEWLRALNPANPSSSYGPPNRTVQENPKPIVTLVSALQRTPYNDREDKKDPEKSLAYIRVQCSVLKYLEKNAADTLEPTQARRWTEAIDSKPKNKRPQAIEALRLCYYMRSQGYDTYADIKNGTISLFLVNDTSASRGELMDTLYWKQDYRTDVVKFRYPSSNARTERRNALSGNANAMLPYPQVRIGSFDLGNSFLDSNERAGDLGVSPDDGPGAESYRDVAVHMPSAPTETPGQGQAAPVSTEQWQSSLDRAEARLNELLSEETPNLRRVSLSDSSLGAIANGNTVPLSKLWLCSINYASKERANNNNRFRQPGPTQTIHYSINTAISQKTDGKGHAATANGCWRNLWGLLKHPAHDGRVFDSKAKSAGIEHWVCWQQQRCLF